MTTGAGVADGVAVEGELGVGTGVGVVVCVVAVGDEALGDGSWSVL